MFVTLHSYLMSRNLADNHLEYENAEAAKSVRSRWMKICALRDANTAKFGSLGEHQRQLTGQGKFRSSLH